MQFAGQARRDGRDDGYAMAALLVTLSIAAIMMTAVMPVWKQMARREKEEELIFRGQQYTRALRLFAMKYANASPPNVDVLVEQRFIRKKYKDPITNDDFQLLLAGQPVPGTTTTPANAGRGQAPGATPGPAPGLTSLPGASQQAPSQPGTTGRGFSPIGTPGAGATGGIIGVVSKSKESSIRLYNGRSHYNEWTFINTPQVQAPGVGAGPGGRGGRGGPGPNPMNPNNPFGTSPFGGRGGPGRGFEPTNPFGGQGGRGPGPTPSPTQPVRPIQPTRPR
jgi:type II secretory pathway pseudopilin PulG